MKKLLFVSIIIAFALLFNACEKSAAPANVVGKWNIVNDSISSSIGIIYYHNNYIGKPSDYFDFRTNDTLYVNEDGKFDTVKYQLVLNDKIIIDGLGILINGTTQPANISITNTNRATITVNSSDLNNPGGTYQRIINLSR